MVEYGKSKNEDKGEEGGGKKIREFPNDSAFLGK